MEGFELEKKQVTVEELDQAVLELKKARDAYDIQKALASELNAEVEKREQILVDLLEASGKSKYELEGVASISMVTRSSIQTPKDLEDKQAFFNWLEEQYGTEGRLAYTSVNSQTLNSLYSTLFKEASDKGEELIIPGLGQPSISKQLRVTSKTKRSK
jgi:translation initiation factor 2 alpha subunit (eIF-2alpha)